MGFKRRWLIIRADANVHIGTGHLMRCMALAQAWQERGGHVTFMSHCQSELLRRWIRREGFDFVHVDRPYPDPTDLNQVIDRLQDSRVSAGGAWVVLDGYQFDPEYQQAVIADGNKLLVIDDMAHHPIYHATILLNQNIYAKKLTYQTDSDTMCLLGTRYVLLRKEFMRWKEWEREICDKGKKILVTFGGADPHNGTLKVLESLIRLKVFDLTVKVVLGPANLSLPVFRSEMSRYSFAVEILTSVSDMPSLMSWADLAISAGGSTCWELAFMGLPSLLVVSAENQKGIAEGFAEAGAGMNLGWIKDLSIDKLAEHLLVMINDKMARTEMSQKCKHLVDGLGSERVILSILR